MLRIALALALIACGSTPRTSGTAQGLTGFGGSGGVQSLAAGNLHDWYGQGGNLWVVSPHASGTTITGINLAQLGGGDQDTITIENRGSVALTFAHENNGSTAANRLHNPGSVNVVLPPGRLIWYTWDVTLDRWHPHVEVGGWGVTATATPARTLNSAFCPNASRPTLVYYSVTIGVDATLSGGERGRVALLADAANPPTTERARVTAGVTAPLLGLTTHVDGGGVLSYLIPPGHCALLQSTDEIGTPSYAITAQAEQTL